MSITTASTAAAGSGQARFTPQEMLAQGIENSRDLLFRFLAGFDDANRTRQGPSLPNHLAWTLGHCALTMHRVAERYLDRQPIPVEDFLEGDGVSGTHERFDMKSISFGSTPADNPAIYPTLDRAKEIFNRAVARLAGAVRMAGDADLQQVVPWGSSGQVVLHLLLARMIFHNGTHAGQLTDLRRAFGMGGVI